VLRLADLGGVTAERVTYRNRNIQCVLEQHIS
jgi:hypothetical protein